MDEANIKYLQTKESLEFALESGRMATWDFDLETNHISCSKEMLDFWGLEPHEFKHERSILQSKVHPEDLERMNAEINKAIENRTIYELEYRIIPRPGQIRWVLSRGRCTYAPNSSHPTRLAGIVYDITEKKNKEMELANALEARSDFFSIAGHELKTPLTCLHLQLKVMECQLEEISQSVTSIDLIQYNLKKQQDQLLRISRIVDNIVDESKISKGLFTFNLEPCDLTEIVSSVLEQINLISQFKGIELNFSILPGIMGKWDRYRLEQVLINLLMNAIHYGNNRPVYLDIIKEADQVLLLVRDEGKGISPEDQARIFKRFERVNPEKSINGMGLGLYIANYIVQAHGGEIRLKSELGKGSEFTVAIPYDSSAKK